MNKVVEEQLPDAVTREVLQQERAKDKTLGMLMEDIQRGACRNSLTRYSRVLTELTVMDSMVVRGTSWSYLSSCRQ